MTKAGTATTPIVFLHIPKTAGQTIHFELARIVGEEAVSPIRVHTQAEKGAAQMPPGYSLYSGHIDWDAIDTLPPDRFVFTVLRDPLERIASFYFYLLRKAEAASPEERALPERKGMRMITGQSADDYFFGGDPAWQRFIQDHYNNLYCSYLVTQKMRGRRFVADKKDTDLVREAAAAARGLDGLYGVDNLGALEQDILERTGQEITVAGRYVNAGPDAGPDAQPDLRWPKLAARLEQDQSLPKLLDFARLDQQLMIELGLASDAPV
ncbi:sulfotransferase family 2 domain-containing protein [uncultured Tateyamaria sp.]|uniref:sulfotransferase family 2 domain-containing protein n=1 Tax=uncultured Tateyamaria sp. TaxID=455651 RepID=UPI0026350648|nr:sulfotransferase family 2 domain-containing protein [uncultured Tateyamaria sp.]